MFQSSLKEAQAFQESYLPNTGSYYRDNRNYSYDLINNRNTTSLLSPYIRYRLLSEEDIIRYEDDYDRVDYKEVLIEMCKKYPNYCELGQKLSSLINNISDE